MKSFKVRTVTQCLPFFSCNFASHIVLLKGASPGFYLYVIVSLCGGGLPTVYAAVMVKCTCTYMCTVCVCVCGYVQLLLVVAIEGKRSEGKREGEREEERD